MLSFHIRFRSANLSVKTGFSGFIDDRIAGERSLKGSGKRGRVQICRRNQAFLALLTIELQENMPWKGVESGVECKSDILLYVWTAVTVVRLVPSTGSGAGKSGNLPWRSLSLSKRLAYSAGFFRPFDRLRDRKKIRDQERDPTAFPADV